MTALQKAAERPRESVPVRSYEFAVVVLLTLLFLWLTMVKIWELRVATEQASIVRTLGSIKSALGVHVAFTVMKHGGDALVPLDRSNPMAFLDPAPDYEVVDRPLSADDMEPYHWYFDTRSGVLTYRVANDDYLETPAGSSGCLRFQLQLGFNDRDNNGRFDRGSDTVTSLRLVTLEPYRWRDVEGGL